jgi:hypothetical protein
MNRFVYISDFYLKDTMGGGELNDHELLLILKSQGHKVTQYRSNLINKSIIKNLKNCYFIISNFVNLNQECKDYIANNCKYIIYEHDHKYLKGRNPALFENYQAPKNEIINFDFYNNARGVFCQTSFHEDIIKKNIDINNIINISGNIWPLQAFELFEEFSLKEKEDKYSILDATIWHKNTSETRFYCEKKGFKYQLISSLDYRQFLDMMSNNDKFIFLPKSPETLSRVVVEARMMGIKTLSNKNVGACYEPWFKLKGSELIKEMKARREQVPNNILKVFNEQ